MSLALIGTIFGIVGTLVSAVAVAWSALTRTTISTLRSSNDAQAERINILASESVRDRAKIDTQATQIATLTSERDTLARVITGEAHLVAIQDSLDSHHSDAMAWWTSLAETLEGIRTALEGK